MVDLESVALALLVGLIGAPVAYLLGIRTVRRQRTHEVKQQAYGRMLSLIEESVGIVGQMYVLQGLKGDDEEQFIGNLLQVIGPLVRFGDREAYYRIDDIEARFVGTKGKTARAELFDALRNHVYMTLTFELNRRGLEFQREVTALNSNPPNPTVAQQLNRVLEMFRGDWGNWGFRRLVRMLGIEGFPEKLDLEARAKAFSDALGVLRRAMQEELKRIL